MSLVTEEQVERQCIVWFKELGYRTENGQILDNVAPLLRRPDLRTVILQDQLLDSLRRINTDIPEDAIQDAYKQILNPNLATLVFCNRQYHEWLRDGVTVVYHEGSNEIGKRVRIIDYDKPENNTWLVVNQFHVKGEKHNRRPDLVVFVNGLPLSVFELKNPADQTADIWAAYNQLQTYKKDIGDLFQSNVCLVVSDGVYARVGSLTAKKERFMRWRAIDSDTVDPFGQHQELETLVKGLFNKQDFLSYVRDFSVFEAGKSLIKKIAAYHQYYAVQNAVKKIVAASSEDGSKRGGVVWHTQGAGKSLEMAFLAGRLISEPRLNNPTIVVITDRQDLDGQLFGVFANSGSLLRESPISVDSRAELREKLIDRPSGGIIFSTIQKFGLKSGETQYPKLSDRHNVIVIADEAHRTQYGFEPKFDGKTGTVKYGYAKLVRDALPNATFVAFTGTPISKEDRDTQAVFGEYISIYDIQQAVDDGATVPISYESRLARITLNEASMPTIDDDVEEILDSVGVDESVKNKARRQWTDLEAIVGSDGRLQEVAEDFVAHYETRCESQFGKAMIVTMSREICIRLYDKIVALRPDWHSADPQKGAIKVVMTASASDPELLQRHHTNKYQKKDIEKRFKDENDELKVVIVRDMWLTGFDVPSLSTMYVDKPMQGANLAQAIARVNRVFKDKPGGLIVDYIGIAQQLKEAYGTYSSAKGTGKLTIDASEFVRILIEKIQVARDLLHPVDWSNYESKALSLIPKCLDHILQLEDGKRRYGKVVTDMTKAHAMCCTTDEAKALSMEVGFHQAVKAPLFKGGSEKELGESKANIDFRFRQLMSEAIVGEGVENIFKLAGLESPDISILSEEFLRDVSRMPEKNLAVELLQSLLKSEIHGGSRGNIIQQRKFSEQLKIALSKYQNRSIEAAQVIEELVSLAKEYKRELNAKKKRNLSSAEEAFYYALASNQSAKEMMGDKILIQMAREIADKLRVNVTVDWTVRENVRAKLRVLVRTLLRRYKYPPDEREGAVDIVLEQATQFAEDTVEQM